MKHLLLGMVKLLVVIILLIFFTSCDVSDNRVFVTNATSDTLLIVNSQNDGHGNSVAVYELYTIVAANTDSDTTHICTINDYEPYNELGGDGRNACDEIIFNAHTIKYLGNVNNVTLKVMGQEEYHITIGGHEIEHPVIKRDCYREAYKLFYVVMNFLAQDY